MNKLRLTFRCTPREIFLSTLADLTVEYPVVSFKLNDVLVDDNIDLAYIGSRQNNNIFFKEYDLDLTKNFDTLSFSYTTRHISYDQIPGLGFQSQEEDSFISDAEYQVIANNNFPVAEVMKVEYSEDGGATYTEFAYNNCYSYMIDGGPFDGKQVASLLSGDKVPGSTREKLTVSAMKIVASQLGLPYTNDGMPILLKQTLGFDAFILLNFDGQSDISSVVTAQDSNIDQHTLISEYAPV